MASVCDFCSSPGACCRGIRLSYKPNLATNLEALVFMASCLPAAGELGLPFIPIERTRARFAEGLSPCPVEEEWIYDCIHLTAAGRCGAYDHRPSLCRTFEAGHDKPCVMRDEQRIASDRDF